jgi:hypothetical protein
MSAIRNILILILTLIFTFQASFISVFAITDEDIIVHSLAELEIPAEIASQDIAGIQSTNQDRELKVDIETLLVANREYSKQAAIAAHTNPENVTTTESIISSNRDTYDAFGDFLIGSGARLLE